MNIFDPKNNFEWHDYIRILKRRKWYFFVPFILVIPLGILKIVMTEPLYESSCSIQIIPNRLLSSNLRRVVPGVIGIERVTSLKTRIRSSEYLTQLGYRLELQKDEKIRKRAKEMQESYPDKQLEEIIELLLIKKLKKTIYVKSYSSDVIEIKATALTPEIAYLIVKTLTEIFIDESLRGELGSVQNALRFNDEQIAVFKEKVEQAEAKLEQYKKSLISKQVENQTLTVESFQRIGEAIVAIEITTRERKEHLRDITLRFKGEDIINNYPNTPAIQRIHIVITEKINQKAALMERDSWKSARVIKINDDIKELSNRIKSEIEKIYAAKYPQQNSHTLNFFTDKAKTLYDLEILDRKKKALDQVLEKFKRTQNPSNELALAKLEEEVAINRKIYNMFLEQNQGAQIEESLQRADASSRFKIIEPARKPLEPINAGYRMILFMTIVLGTSLAGGAVYLGEYLDKSIRSVQDAEEFFQIPVLGVLPYFSEEKPAIRQRNERFNGNTEFATEST